jgi:hypothetical protein
MRRSCRSRLSSGVRTVRGRLNQSAPADAFLSCSAVSFVPRMEIMIAVDLIERQSNYEYTHCVVSHRCKEGSHNGARVLRQEIFGINFPHAIDYRMQNLI